MVANKKYVMMISPEEWNAIKKAGQLSNRQMKEKGFVKSEPISIRGEEIKQSIVDEFKND